MTLGACSAAVLAALVAFVQHVDPTALDTVAQLRTATATTPRNPGAWYALGQGYNAIKQDALASLTADSDAPWRALVSADALLENGHLTDAFALYRAAQESLPQMITIHSLTLPT